MIEKPICPKCKGVKIDAFSGDQKMCEEHDRCVGCEIKRAELDRAPWHHKDGFKCHGCRDKEIQAEIDAFQLRLKEEGDGILDYTDEAVCPNCGTAQSDYSEYVNDHELDCGNCDYTMKLETDISVSFTTCKK